MRVYLLLLLAIGSLNAMSKAPAAPPVEAVTVGVHTLKYEDDARKRPVLVELWHPTEDKAPLDTPADLVWVHPKEIRGAAIPNGKYPLIVMSHGNGGTRRDMSWLAERLVQQGFIVASIEHHGNSAATFHPLTTLCFWERSRDVSFVIDQLHKEPLLENIADLDRIGFIGYSLGGMTGLSLGGAVAKNLKEVAEAQQKRHKAIDLDALATLDISPGYANYKEPRIKAIALLSPAAFVFPTETLSAIKTPVALITSEGDEILPFQEHALKLIVQGVPSKLKILRDKVSHFVFLNHVSYMGKNFLCKEMHTDALQKHRSLHHEEIGAFVTDFFKEQLKE